MPLTKITLSPGINAQISQTSNPQGWYASNLIRWRYGQLEKIGGWHSLTATPCSGRVRFMHAYADLTGAEDLLLGTDGGLQIYVNNTLNDVSLARKTSLIPIGGIAATSGSNVFTVTDNANGAAVGDKVYISITQLVGGLIIYPQNVTVATASTNSWTFNYSQNATATNTSTTPAYVSQIGSSQTLIIISGNSYSVGDNFQVQYSVVFNQLGATVSAGTYKITQITSPNDIFTIDSGVVATVDSAVGYAYNSAGGTPITYPQQPPATPANWFVDNLGNFGIISYTSSSIYQWTPPVSATGFSSAAIISGAPTINAGTLVAMPQAQIIAFGSETIIGSGIQDPLLLRFSDAGNPNVWTATVSNQAGSYRLSRGSVIVGALQAPQSTLVWTDIDLWAMPYVGPPFIYSFTIIGSGCGLIAPHAAATIGPSTFWMGTRAFWMYAGAAVQTIPCSVWDIVYYDIDRANESKSFAGSISSFAEVFFFYPSKSGGTGECDSYVKYNVAESLWDYGKLVRSAWIDSNVIGPPLGADNSYLIQRHEEGYDNDLLPMSGVYTESGYAEISNGADMIFFDQFIPDMKWFGSNGSLNVTVFTKNYPGDQPTQYGPYSITSEGQFLSLRGRARYVALRYDWAATSGFSARLGVSSLRASPSGKRP